MHILETDRLVLEELSDQHLEDLYTLLSNANVQRFFPNALSREETVEFLDVIKKKYRENGVSFWAVILKGSNHFIGICGVLKQIIDGVEEFEIAYRILDTYWGRGYGTEAARGCMDYARDKLGTRSVISLIREINKPSARVAEKNGLSFEREIMFHGLPHRVYRKTWRDE